MPAPIVNDTPRLLRTRHHAEAQAIARSQAHVALELAAATPGGVLDPAGRRALRGIPVVGGVSGTSPNTDPAKHVRGYPSCRCDDCLRHRRTNAVR